MQASDTYKAMIHIPLRHFGNFEVFLAQRPIGAILVGVEMGGIPLAQFEHPRQAIYLLGAEDHGLPPAILERCNQVVSLEAVGKPSYNVAGSIILYDRVFGPRLFVQPAM